MIQKLIRFDVPWEKECERILKEYKEKTYPETSGLIEAKSDTLLYCEKTNIELTEEEKYTLLKLPNKSYILSFVIAEKSSGNTQISHCMFHPFLEINSSVHSIHVFRSICNI